MSAPAWNAALDPAYQDFRRRVRRRENTAIDPYAAEHPGEFFAVLSEVFFADPTLLLHEYPDVYGQLRLFYRQDPAARAELLQDE
jgi:Mlc titration factor MtfA (ptsG expression regulator)